MNAVVFDPLEEYNTTLKLAHAKNAKEYLDALVQQSGVDVEQNRRTVKLHMQCKENLSAIKKKMNRLRFWRVIMCITLVLIPVVIAKMTPKIRAYRAQIEDADNRADQLMEEAQQQMLPLNCLFSEGDALRILEKTLPLMSFAPCFSAEQEWDMKQNYDFSQYSEDSQSTVDVLAGHYNENPFLFEKRVIHTMGTQTYTGTKTISWTETRMGTDGKLHRETKTQTLEASVTKPKPYYKNKVILSYCAQAGPELSFSRDADHVERKSEKQLERHVKRGEKQLKKKTDKAIRENDDFMAMSNSDFEVLFDALDRSDEVQFRTLFTPLAQTNMVSLLCSRDGFGDDFEFKKSKRTNRIISEHSQSRALNVSPQQYVSHCYDTVEESFLQLNMAFFKNVYFDFAPLLAIPAYQERPVHSLEEPPRFVRQYSSRQYEVLANAASLKEVAHPASQTQAILKATYMGTENGVDKATITAYTYNIENRIDYVSVLGGDGRFHNVPVEWKEYLPLEVCNRFCIAPDDRAEGNAVLVRRNGLCLMKN